MNNQNSTYHNYFKELLGNHGNQNLIQITKDILCSYSNNKLGKKQIHIGIDSLFDLNKELITNTIVFFSEKLIKDNLKEFPVLQIGDSVISILDFKVYEIKELNPIKGLRIQPTRATKREELDITNFSWIGRDKINQVQQKIDHYKKICNSGLPFKNPNKIAILSEKSEIFKLIPDFIPSHYINKNGETDGGNLTFFDPLLIVSNSFDSLKNTNLEFEYLIAIGNKYVDAFANISEACVLGKIQKCIFIGTENVISSENFPILKWKWTLPEIVFTQGKHKESINSNIISDEIFLSFKNEIKKIDSKFRFSLENIQKQAYRNLFRLVFKNEVENFQKYMTDKIQETLIDEFYNIDYEGETEITNLQNSIIKICNKLKSDTNPKVEYFKNLQEDIQYIVVPSKQKNDWQKIQRNLTLPKSERVINLNDLNKSFVNRNITHYPYKALKNASVISFKEYKDHKGDEFKYLFLSLFGYGIYPEDLLHLIRKKNNFVTILLYSNEKQIFDWLKRKDHWANLKEYKSEDRFNLIGIQFEEDDLIQEQPEISEDWIRLLLENQNQLKEDHKSIYKYEITFEGNSKSLKLFENKTVFVEKIEGNKKKVKDLKKGDLTRIYQNPNKEILHDIFECFDNTNLFKRVNEKSNFWKEILRNLQNIRNLSEEEIYKTLVNAGLSITFDSYQNWVKKDSKIKFPKSIKDLAIILREANPQSIILLVKDYKILINEYNSRMVKSGAEFSNEVENYILTRKKGKMLEMLSNTDIDKIVDDNAPLRTIKSITLIEDDIYE